MKKLIACPACEYAQKLFTIDRWKEIAYFVDDYEGFFELTLDGEKKKINNYEYLHNENLDDIIIIIADSQKYESISTKLSSMGLRENVHYYNGWKLNHNFYMDYYGRQEWIDEEEKDQQLLIKARDGWKRRARYLAELIPKDVKSLMDIGCGESLIKEYLPENMQYYGVDYCRRDENTIVRDLNKELLPDISVDVYYMAGFFAYVDNIKDFLNQLSAARYVIMSHIHSESFIRLDGKIPTKQFSNFGTKEYYISNLITDMYEVGFVCEKVVWNYVDRDEFYLRFRKGK